MGNPPDNEIPVLTNADIEALVDTPAPFTNDDLSPITDAPVPVTDAPDLIPLGDFIFDDFEDFEDEVEPETPAAPTLAEMNAATRRIRR